jgi:predicted nucleotidyltransferase
MDKVPKPIRDVILELEKGLKELYGDRFRGLLLYGSYARGTAWEGSDVDLLLLLEGPVDSGREIMRLQAVKSPIALEADLALSVIPVSLEDFKQGKSMFLRVVRKEAIAAAA